MPAQANGHTKISISFSGDTCYAAAPTASGDVTVYWIPNGLFVVSSVLTSSVTFWGVTWAADNNWLNVAQLSFQGWVAFSSTTIANLESGNTCGSPIIAAVLPPNPPTTISPGTYMLALATPNAFISDLFHIGFQWSGPSSGLVVVLVNHYDTSALGSGTGTIVGAAMKCP